MGTGGSAFALVLRNPASRRAIETVRLERAAAVLRRAGWAVEVRDTAGRGESTHLAREAAEAGASAVVACGGDGTVNEVANGLAGSETALAVVPAGTANIWAREAFVPATPERALALVARGRRVRVDLGLARTGEVERRFLLMSGAGLDATVVREVDARPGTKRRLGKAAFALPAARALLGARPVEVEVRHPDGEERIALLLGVAGNTRLYGGVLRLASAARIDDGLLDLVTFADPHPGARRPVLRYARLLGRALRGRLDAPQSAGIAYRRAPWFELRPQGPLPVQVDGELLGLATPQAPLRLEVVPSALDVVVGRQPNVLLGEG